MEAGRRVFIVEAAVFRGWSPPPPAAGLCECYQGYYSSDGYNQPGEKGDCGAALDPIATCPGSPLECSGHGRCSDSPMYLCTCAVGWMGGDCSERTCLRVVHHGASPVCLGDRRRYGPSLRLPWSFVVPSSPCLSLVSLLLPLPPSQVFAHRATLGLTPLG